MRDINRIPEILGKLEDYWRKNPDLRLGQILVNLCYDKDHCYDYTYFTEDGELLKKLEAELKEIALLERYKNTES